MSLEVFMEVALSISKLSKDPSTKVGCVLVSPDRKQNLEKRRITSETCAKFGYQVGSVNGESWHIAPYYDSEGKLAQ